MNGLISVEEFLKIGNFGASRELANRSYEQLIDAIFEAVEVTAMGTYGESKSSEGDQFALHILFVGNE